MEKAKMMDEHTIVKLSEIFKCMSDPTRLKIIYFLSNGEANVQAIADALEMEHSAISHQLKNLKDLKLVKSRRDGKLSIYSLDDDHVLKLFTQGLDHVSHSCV